MRNQVRSALCALLLATAVLLPAAAQAQEDEAETEGTGFVGGLNRAVSGVDAWFGEWIVGPMATVFFLDVAFWDDGEGALRDRAAAAGMSSEEVDRFAGLSGDDRMAYCTGELEMSAGECTDVANGIALPFIVLWLVVGAVFFTIRYAFVNIRGFGHAIAVTAGRYDKSDDPGEVSHFQALSSALSATVGLGNIAGVAVAVGAGGPGAVFWMVVAGFLGMSSKFTECTLGQLYRKVDPTGRVSGGPMRYLSAGMAELGPTWKPVGQVLAVMFAIMCIGGSLGGGNMFQANQSAAQIANIIPWFGTDFGKLLYGVLLAALVGVVIIGGIRRIGAVAGYIVPVMCAIYVLAGLIIIVMNAGQVGQAFGEIVGMAFTPQAGFGGLLGVLIQGFKRAAFSNEAGIGSASIAHSAAATDEPVREGIVALLEPFIDTIIVCTMTGLVVVITGAWSDSGKEGIEMTSWAFRQELGWFPMVLAFAAFMFAFSTMISWSYYGERCWTFLVGSGEGKSMVYRVVFLVFVVLGSILELGNVITFSDLMVLGMAFPNILGLYFLSGKVAAALRDYWKRYKAGEMVVQKRTKAAGDGG